VSSPSYPYSSIPPGPGPFPVSLSSITNPSSYYPLGSYPWTVTILDIAVVCSWGGMSCVTGHDGNTGWTIQTLVMLTALLAWQHA
jgi:hypothetical protein